MRHKILGISVAIAALIVANDTPKRALTITHNPQKRNSNKLNAKGGKRKASAKYKSSKPLKSKAVTQYRNKSNI